MLILFPSIFPSRWSRKAGDLECGPCSAWPPGDRGELGPLVTTPHNRLAVPYVNGLTIKRTLSTLKMQRFFTTLQGDGEFRNRRILVPPDKQRAGRATGKSLPVQRAHGSVSCRGRGAWGVCAPSLVLRHRRHEEQSHKLCKWPSRQQESEAQCDC